MGRQRLVSVRASTRPGKKMVAVFETAAGTTKTVHFGARSYGDFTKYWKRDPALARAKRQAYIRRHGAQEKWTDPTTPATLSRYILWEKPTTQAGVAAFKRRFRV
jgi:hypothetical protein